MPGFIQNVCDTSYGTVHDYVGPYVDPYVQKTRNAVPLLNKAANMVEERVPPLITKVDKFAEPTIEKIRPKVEPIVKKSVEEAEKLKGLAKPYYEGGAQEIKKAKELVIALEKEGVKQVEDIRADVQQLYRHPSDVQQLYRVPKVENLQELKSVSKINMLLDKVQTVIDRYLPPPPNNMDAQSDDSCASEKSAVVPRVMSIPSMLIHRIAFNVVRLAPKKEDLTLANLKAVVEKAKGDVVKTLTTTSCSVKTKVCTKIALAYAKAKPFVEKQSESMNKTKLGKFIIATATSAVTKANVIGEKVLGKEKMQACIAKVQESITCTPAPAATKPAAAPKKKEVPPKTSKKDGPTDKAA